MVREFLLGDNPFIGVSHLSQEKAREESKEATLKNKVKVFKSALKGGATGFTFSTHPANLDLLTYLREHEINVLKEMNYYPLVPYAQTYVRRANVRGTPALVKSILRSTVKHPSRILDSIVGIVTLSPERFITLFIETELSPYLKTLPRTKIKAIFLHEILTEFIVAFDLLDLVKYLDKTLKKRLKIGFGLETRNIGQLYRWLDKAGYYPEYIMTPMNPLGYQMAPNKEVAENSILKLCSKSKIVAINILASGAVSLSEAIEYLIEFKNKIYAVTSASTKPERIHNNFKTLRCALSP